MSDLISREKLKKEAESLRVTVMGLRSGKGILAEYAKHYRESFLRMIDEQPTVEPVRGEWIPCSERLPEGCKEAELEVLISTKEIYPDAYFNEAGFALYYPETKTFHSVYGDRLDITEIVIAWQYLPEPFSADREKVTE